MARLKDAFLTKDLTDEQLAELMMAGEEMRFDEGDVVFREGEPADFLWIFLEGKLELTRQVGGNTLVLMQMTNAGQWAGGLRAWGDASNSAGYRATGTVLEPTRMFALPSAELARLMGRWFPFGKHIITGIYQTVRSIEATARQRESLVALGGMAAGLAHELNNPASAALRAVDDLRRTSTEALGALTDLARHAITADQYVALDELRLEVTDRPAPEGAVAQMDAEDTVGGWLESHGVSQAWTLAPALAGAGADVAWLSRVEDLVGRGPLEPACRWVASTVTMRALMSDLTDTTNRISNLVGQVKEYSKMDRSDRERSSVRAGLESTLAMLGPKLSHVAVELTVAPDVPDIDAYHAELNQVWTNLIDNAVDAMEGEGSLRIDVRREGGQVVVDVSDSGPGIPDAVAERIFEPFFTTKDVGKGTGLGLDISRRIVVERHNGEITFDSSPHGTTAHVRLPIG